MLGLASGWRSRLRSLGFRIVAPVVAMTFVLGIGLYVTVLRSVSDFAHERIQEDLASSSREIYSVFDAALQNLLVVSPGDPVAMRIKQGRALGDVEEYLQRNNLNAVIYHGGNGEILLGKGLPIDASQIVAQAPREGTVAQRSFAGTAHYVRHFRFDLWDWHVVLMRDGAVYASLVDDVRASYLHVGITLLAACALLVYYLKRVVHDPIRAIVASILAGGLPHYRGTRELEFLSDSVRAMTERQRREQQEVSYQASHDALTGLVNRREFERRLDLLLDKPGSNAAAHTVLYLDLDQFKIVNDSCGHIAGDELLKQLTSRLKGRVRHDDTLARLGGDEFGILLENCPPERGASIAELLRVTVSEFQFVWQGKAFVVGASIGLVSFGDEGFSRADVMRLADAACYVAKDDGRNRIHVYRPEDDALAQRHREMSWVGRIRAALDEDRFVLHAQKILALGADEDAEHHEVLVRMIDEDGRLVPPMAFIPSAERYNLMPALDRRVVQMTFAHWQAHCAASQPRRHFSVNLSGASLSDESFLPYVREQFERYAVLPSAICFEITETAAIANLVQATVFIRSLKAMGCRFALDDFGSGMSSFAYLKQLDVDFLKIDGAFVKDILTDPIDRAMVESINHIGHVMGVRTIAEFVENDAILHELRAIGVDYAQGYGIGKPQPLLPAAPLRAAPMLSVSAYAA